MSQSGSNAKLESFDMTEAGAGIGPWAWPGDEEFTQAEISIPKRKTSFLSRPQRCTQRPQSQKSVCAVGLPAASLLASYMVYTTATAPCPTAYKITQTAREPPAISGHV